MSFVPVMNLVDWGESDRHVVEVNGLSLLLVRMNEKFFVIENRCGHFGVPLVDGTLQQDAIYCRQHRVKFSLQTGEVLNDIYDDCDPVRVFAWRVNNGTLEVDV